MDAHDAVEETLTVKGAINGKSVLGMSSDAVSNKTVKDLRREIYKAIGEDSSDVDLLLTVAGRTLQDIEQLETLAENTKPVEVLLIVQAAPEFDESLPRNEQISILKRMLSSSKIEKQKLSSELLRKMLTTDDRKIFQMVIEGGLLPRLVQLARGSVDLEVQHDALWALSIISCAPRLCAQQFVDYGALDIFVKKLSSPVQNERDQAIMAIGNVVTDSVFLRDIALSSGAFAGILQELENLDADFNTEDDSGGYTALLSGEKVGMYEMPRQVQTVWALCNLCKGQPPPRMTLIEPALEEFKRLLGEDNEDINFIVLKALSNITNNDINVVDVLVKKGFSSLVVKELRRVDGEKYQPNAYDFSDLLGAALDLLYQLLSGTHAHKQELMSCNVLDILHSILAVVPNTLHPPVHVRIAACRAISKFFEGSSDDIQHAIDKGSILELNRILASDKKISVKEVALHALCCGALGGTLEQMVVITKACIRSVLSMLKRCKEQSTIEVLNVLERILANHKRRKRRWERIDTTVANSSSIVKIIVEESVDKIAELVKKDLHTSLVSSKARSILSKLESMKP